MARDYPRSYRVADQIQIELANLIRSQLKDPGIAPLLTISAVDVSRDLSIAKVYVTVLEQAQRQSSMDALARASGYLRSQLAGRLMLRTVPQLRFYYDDSSAHGERLSRLIDAAVDADQRAGEDAPRETE